MTELSIPTHLLNETMKGSLLHIFEIRFAEKKVIPYREF